VVFCQRAILEPKSFFDQDTLHVAIAPVEKLTASEGPNSNLYYDGQRRVRTNLLEIHLLLMRFAGTENRDRTGQVHPPKILKRWVDLAVQYSATRVSHEGSAKPWQQIIAGKTNRKRLVVAEDQPNIVAQGSIVRSLNLDTRDGRRSCDRTRLPRIIPVVGATGRKAQKEWERGSHPNHRPS
jgi:hypothetical protein